MKNLYYITCAFLLFSFISFGQQISVNNDLSDNALIQTLVGGGVTISNIEVNGAAHSYGQFTNGEGIGFSQGILLTTGSIEYAVGPNFLPHGGLDNNSEGSTLLDSLNQGETQDACEISFDIVPEGCRINFDYVFASEEYHEFVGSQFNDVFGFFISGPGIAGNLNIALIPDTATPVAINTVNNGFSFDCPVGDTPFFTDNCNGQSVQYDGYTKPFRALANGLTPGETYRITLAIADVFDGKYDSGVFIKSQSFFSTPTSAAFEVEYECTENGTYDATVTAIDQNASNHLWQIYETAQQGETHGGNQVGNTQNGVTATFYNLDPNKFYYINHEVLGGNCSSPTTEQLALDYSPHTLSPAFEIVSYDYNYEDCTYNVTVTALDENSPKHWWRLRETNQQGETQGGDNVGNTQDGDTATFTNLDPDKFYYITHAVWSDCESWKGDVLALDYTPPPVSTAFEIEYECTGNDDCTYNVIVTASDENFPNHWWRLREITQQGDVDLGNPQNGVTATFNNLDLSKSYSITHAVYSDCVDFTGTTLALKPPQCCSKSFFITDPCLTTNELSSKNHKVTLSDITSKDKSLTQKTCDPCIQGYADVYLVDSDGNPIDDSMYDSILWSNGDTTEGSRAYPGELISVAITVNEQPISTAEFLFRCADLKSLEDLKGNDHKRVRKTTKVKISPNPNSGKMNLKVETNTDIRNITLTIQNINGNIINRPKDFKFKNGILNHDLDLSSRLEQGVYFFVFTIGNETITKQIIIK